MWESANGLRQQEALGEICSQWIDLPAGSFKSEGTNVNAAIIVLDIRFCTASSATGSNSAASVNPYSSRSGAMDSFRSRTSLVGFPSGVR